MFLDIALGVTIGMGTAAVFGWEQVVPFVVGGVVFALLPDVDFIIHRVWKKRNAHFDYLHRDILHKPLLYIFIGATGTYIIGDMPWTILFISASFAHFLHDMTGVGYGVKWLYPFSSKLIGFKHAGLARCVGKKVAPFICAVPSDRVDAYVKAQPLPQKDWIHETYLTWSKTARIEYIFLFIVIVSIGTYIFLK